MLDQAVMQVVYLVRDAYDDLKEIQPDQVSVDSYETIQSCISDLESAVDLALTLASVDLE